MCRILRCEICSTLVGNMHRKPKIKFIRPAQKAHVGHKSQLVNQRFIEYYDCCEENTNSNYRICEVISAMDNIEESELGMLILPERKILSRKDEYSCWMTSVRSTIVLLNLL